MTQDFLLLFNSKFFFHNYKRGSIISERSFPGFEKINKKPTFFTGYILDPNFLYLNSLLKSHKKTVAHPFYVHEPCLFLY